MLIPSLLYRLAATCCVLHFKSTHFSLQQTILLPLDPRSAPSAKTRLPTPECKECAVCASGYGKGAASECHRCTTGFKAGMYFVVTIVAVFALVVMALLAVYLVRRARATM